MTGQEYQEQKIVLVTGASSGIGRATAFLLSHGNYKIILVARRSDKLNTLKNEIGTNAISMPCDCSNYIDLKNLCQEILGIFGAPDIIIHCAGAGVWREIEETTPEQLKSMMAVPFESAFNINAIFIPEMMKKKSGLLIHVNSPVCYFPWGGATGYASARWALRGMHEALNQDLEGMGVKSCQITFGEVKSEYFESNPNSHEKIPKISFFIPVQTPEQCAKVIERVIGKPKRNTFHPLMLRVFIILNQFFPFITESSIRFTQRKR